MLGNADGLEQAPWKAKLRSKAGWADAATYTMADLKMLRRELLIGFTVAGFLAVVVPAGLWNAVFIHGHGFATTLENALVGPFIAVVSFVCSIGNVPLAAALWKGGISFGGVVSFLFADLISFPLLLVYRRYYGTRLMLRMLVSLLGGDVGGGTCHRGDLQGRRARAEDTSEPGGAATFLLGLHDLSEHRVSRPVRSGLLGVPQQGAPWWRQRLRPRPGVRHAGRDDQAPRRACHRAARSSTSARTTAEMRFEADPAGSPQRRTRPTLCSHAEPVDDLHSGQPGEQMTGEQDLGAADARADDDDTGVLVTWRRRARASQPEGRSG